MRSAVLRARTAARSPRVANRHRLCRHLATQQSEQQHQAPTLDENMRKLLFLVHPDLFPEGTDAKSANETAVKTILGYVDEHRDLLDGMEGAELPSHSQPVMARLFLRPKDGGAEPGAAEPGAVTAVLHATTQAQPAGFEKSMDKLFSLVGLPPVFAGQTLTQRNFVKGSVGWVASQAGPELRAAAARHAEAEKNAGALQGLLLQVHAVRVIFPRGVGGARGEALPMAVRERLLMELSRLLCEHEVGTGAEPAAFEARPGWSYGVDGRAGFQEPAPAVPPAMVFLCQIDPRGDAEERTDPAGAEGRGELDVAWDAGGRRLWLGASAAGEPCEGWAHAVAALRRGGSAATSPQPAWLGLLQTAGESVHVGDAAAAVGRAEQEEALAAALGLAFVAAEPQSLEPNDGPAFAMYDEWLSQATALSSRRRGLAARTVSNMRPSAEQQEEAEQRRSLQRLGLLVRLCGGGGARLDSPEPQPQPPEPEPEPEDGITLALVDDTLVLRCGLSCTAESLWAFVARGDGGGNEAGAAADRQHKLASRALESVEATRQALGLGTLRCAEGVGWEAQLRACERLRGRATRLRPVLAGLRLELVDASTQAQAQHADGDDDDKEELGYVVADAELGVLRVDVEARLV